MAGEIVVAISNPDDIVDARKAGHQLALDLGFSLTDVTMIATAISEVARNITSYAGHGAVRVEVADREGRKALVIHAEDEGPGIADIERAMEDGYSTGRGLGLGLPGARRLMDRLIVESALGRGTVVEMWKWVPARAEVIGGRLGPIEWAMAGRPSPGEHVCGDQSIAVGIEGQAALFGVLDGLGHGPSAAKAAIAGVEVLINARGERVEVLVQLCHRVLDGTRGAAMTLAHIDFQAGQLYWTGVGNVTRQPGRQGCHWYPDPFFCSAGRRHHRLPDSGNLSGTSSSDTHRRSAHHRQRRNRRRSPGPHRLRRLRHGDCRTNLG